MQGHHTYQSTATVINMEELVPHQSIFDEVKRQEKTALFLNQLMQRFWKMEGIIAEAKNLHGLKRAKYRGRAKVQIQAYLTASVQNIKRLITFRGKIGLYLLKSLLKIRLKSVHVVQKVIKLPDLSFSFTLLKG